LSATRDSPEATDDGAGGALLDFLRAAGAGEMRHGGGRTLLEHLVETRNLIGRWGQPESLQRAALIHSVYGTDVYRGQLLRRSRRDELARVAGAEAERLAYLFSVTPRGPLLAGTYTWMRSPAHEEPHSEPEAPDTAPATREELDALVLLHMANLAEQARAADGSPAPWLVTLRQVAEPLLDSAAVDLPSFVALTLSLTEEDESLGRRSYLRGLREDEDPAARVGALGLAAAVLSVVAEPCVWQAHLAWRRDDPSIAQAWAATARRRLDELGTAWDKRLSFEEWRRLAVALERSDPHDPAARNEAIGDPRRLFELTVGAGAGHPARSERGARGAAPDAPPDARAGIARFHRYVESLGGGDDVALGRVYPELESRPWHDPRRFPLAEYLEANFPAIREEIVALDHSGFHRESERIERSGDWDVAFFYERGRRRDELCEACPVTTRGIETLPAMRTVTGLIYVSRMRAGTHIAAHRGPTNLRLRCHLGIEVPSGDCAIRVGEETRWWEEGRSLVFDDFCEHEAWNHTDQDRIVLIVDLWHPGLSAAEVRLLEGLQRYAYGHARTLGRYWSANAAAARSPAES
jgi:aspartate beta-hydroxylase